jgi:hypothetical protein
MEMIVIAVFVLAAACSTIAGWRRAKRRAAIESIAARAGLQYAEEDPFNCTRVAFGLFRKGDGRGAENVMWRAEDDGKPVRVFDFWYYTEHRTDNGGTTRTYERFTCATALVNGSWPSLTISREGLLDKFATSLGLPDLDFESEEFQPAVRRALRGPALRERAHRSRHDGAAAVDPRRAPLRAEGPVAARGVAADRTTSDARPAGCLRRVPPADPARCVGPVPVTVSSTPTASRCPSRTFRSRHRRTHPSTTTRSRLSTTAAGGARRAGPAGSYDLDGHLVAPVVEDPWRDAPSADGGPRAPAR